MRHQLCMNKTKQIFILGFAIFSLFFGAGNLILPPNMGFKAGEDWWLVTIGFICTAVIVPILGIVAHAKLQGTMYDFGKKVSHKFSLLYCFLMYAIALALPAPRTASVTHEMAIEPWFQTPSWVTSSLYFLLVFVFVMNRSKILDLIGKYLTPLIGIILLAIIGVSLASFDGLGASVVSEASPFVGGILEGYQTYDAIGGVVVGAVIVISLNIKGIESYQLKREMILKAGLIAGGGLLLIYTGLIFSGAIFSESFLPDSDRTSVLIQLSKFTLGLSGTNFLSVLVALACFTTAVGIVAGTADYFKGLFPRSKYAFLITTVIGCVLGVVMGQLDVHDIIVIAIPILLFIYPITIVLVLLNILPNKYVSPMVFRAVTFVTVVFAVFELWFSLKPNDTAQVVLFIGSLGTGNLSWAAPALLAFIIAQLIPNRANSSNV
ncbi:branched-chain amino acid transport system II carrier protein [Urechidicola sp. KH5]